jgi:hypothetical protein
MRFGRAHMRHYQTNPNTTPPHRTTPIATDRQATELILTRSRREEGGAKGEGER